MGKITESITERRGINAVEAYFNNIGWVFRETPHTDCGIDGEVEQTINKELTGMKIALQIKSGESYLKENKAGNIVFYIDEWHYKYWLQYSMPVLILFYDEANKRIIWDHVKLANIEQTTTRHKIELSPSKVLNEYSIEELNDIIQTYQPHHFYELTTDFDSFEFSLDCFHELNRSFILSCNELQHFKDKIQKQLLNPNPAILLSTINRLANQLKKYNADDYEYLHKGSWYLSKMAENISALLYEAYTTQVNKFITVINENIKIWKSIKADISKLKHPNIPHKIQSCATQCNMVIENRIACFELVKNEYNNCLATIETRTQ